MSKGKRKPAVRQGTRERFLELVQNDKSIDWERKVLGERSLVLDIVYLLGISVDEKKYAYFQGMREFAKDCGVDLDMKKVDREEIKK